MRPAMVLLPLLSAIVSCVMAQNYDDSELLNREREDYRLTLSTPTRPHIGKNRVLARLSYPSRRPITNAQVTFRYQMPGMRGSANGVQTDEGIYEAEVDLGMGGEWTITVEIERPAFEKIEETFVIDAE